MKGYRLYKGAWIAIDESKSKFLDATQIKELLSKGGCFIRNIYNFDTSAETSFWYVIKDSFGGLEELSTGARRDVRKSLRIYDAFQITSEELLEIGYPIYSSAQESYKVKCEVLSTEQYEQMVKNYASDGDKEFWGLRHKESGEFVALAINTIKENSCEYNVLKC